VEAGPLLHQRGPQLTLAACETDDEHERTRLQKRAAHSETSMQMSKAIQPPSSVGSRTMRATRPQRDLRVPRPLSSRKRSAVAHAATGRLRGCRGRAHAPRSFLSRTSLETPTQRRTIARTCPRDHSSAVVCSIMHICETCGTCDLATTHTRMHLPELPACSSRTSTQTL
jgi:hypothetical protein